MITTPEERPWKTWDRVPLSDVYVYHVSRRREQGLPEILEPVPRIGALTLRHELADMVDGAFTAVFATAANEQANIRLTFDYQEDRRGVVVGIECEPPLVGEDSDEPIPGLRSVEERAAGFGGQLTLECPEEPPLSLDIARVELVFPIHPQ